MNSREESSFFRGEIEYLLDQPVFDRPLFSDLLNAWGICNAGRVRCLLLMEEMEGAFGVASRISRHYDMFDRLNPVDLQKTWSGTARLEEITDFIQGVRDAQDAAATNPYLIRQLMDKGISGRDYVERLREEQENPILALPA